MALSLAPRGWKEGNLLDGDLSNPYDGEFYKVSDKAYNFTDCYFDIEMLIQYSNGEIMTITNDWENFEAIIYKNAIFFCESVVLVSDIDNPLGLDVGVYFYGSDDVFIKSFKATLTPITEPIDVNIEFECDYNNLENIEQFGDTNLLKVSDEVFNLSGTESNVTIGFKWIYDGKVELVYSGTDNYYVETFKNGFLYCEHLIIVTSADNKFGASPGVYFLVVDDGYTTIFNVSSEPQELPKPEYVPTEEEQ